MTQPAPKLNAHPPIYVVTVLSRHRNFAHRERTWGWRSSLDAATSDALGNVTDMFEAGYYNFAVIEETPEGVGAISKALR